MLIHTVDPDLDPDTPEGQREAMDSLYSWFDALDAAGARMLHGSRLRPPEDAATVRIREDRLIVTDGPFAETKEQIGGYAVVECSSLAEAVRLAGLHPHSVMGSTEVRALPENAPAGPLPEPSPGATRYLLLVCTDPAVDPRILDDMDPVDPWVADTDSRGIRVFGSELAPADTARTTRMRDGHVLVTDGPFAETKEQIAGFDLLDCADMDEVVAVATRHPMARGGILEVRPLWPFEDYETRPA
jgi:hypothetical protein